MAGTRQWQSILPGLIPVTDTPARSTEPPLVPGTSGRQSNMETPNQPLHRMAARLRAGKFGRRGRAAIGELARSPMGST